LNRQQKVFFVAFSSNPTNPDLILHKDRLKEYGNQAPVIRRPKFDLKSTEALLEYKVTAIFFQNK
jgi:hypothetical protein